MKGLEKSVEELERQFVRSACSCESTIYVLLEKGALGAGTSSRRRVEELKDLIVRILDKNK